MTVYGTTDLLSDQCPDMRAPREQLRDKTATKLTRWLRISDECGMRLHMTVSCYRQWGNKLCTTINNLFLLAQSSISMIAGVFCKCDESLQGVQRLPGDLELGRTIKRTTIGDPCEFATRHPYPHS